MSTETTGRKRGRPAQGGPVVAGTRNGAGVGWCDGQFAGDAEIVRDARAAITEGRRIWLGRAVQAGAGTAAEATAALLAAGVTVQQAPEDLLILAGTWQQGDVAQEAGSVPLTRAQRLAALSETHYTWSLRQETPDDDLTVDQAADDAGAEPREWQPLVADGAAEDEFLTEARRVLDQN